ncbi:MAG: TetR/AcrR family transcriptional regulator [Geminicoccaceae bacterium]
MPGATSEATVNDRIIDGALELAEECGWHDLRLHHIAGRLDLSLAEVGHHFRDPDAIANAWFARAEAEMSDFSTDDLTPPDRLYRAMTGWLDALAPHRRVTGQMLRAKLYPSHPHHWVPMIFDLSRLIHWFLDAARIESTGRRRQWAEIGLTLIFLATLRDWLQDRSEDQTRTQRKLRRRLESADRWLGRCC